MAVNRMVLQGRFVADPILRENANGTKYVFFDLAHNTYFNKENQTHFIPCVAYGRNAETISKYFKKGNEIIIEGRQMTQQIKTDDGYFKNFITNNVDIVHFVSNRSERDGEETQDNNRPEEVGTAPTGF